MKLEAKAKPIRIRIKMGEEECSSIEGFKQHLSVQEILPLLKDGRLERWLRQIQKVDLAEQVKELIINDVLEAEDYKKILSIFFKEVNQETNLRDLAFSWINQSINIEVANNILEFLINNDIEAAKYCYKNDNRKTKDWPKIFNKFITFDIAMALYKDIETRTIYTNWGEVFKPYLTLDIAISLYNNTDTWIIYSDWGLIFKEYLTLDIAKNLYFDESTRSIYRDWGKVFGQLIYNEIDFTKATEYLKELIISNSSDFDTMAFYNQTSSYWTKWLNTMTISELTQLIDNNKELKSSINYWINLFADKTTDYTFEDTSTKIMIRFSNKEYIDYCKNCLQRGISAAKDKLDPWFILRNSYEKDIVLRALDNWDGDYRHYDKNVYNYVFLKDDLAIQLIAFLEGMISLRRNGYWNITNERHTDKYYLHDERNIMERVSARYREYYDGLTFNKDSIKELERLSKSGVSIADSILNQQHDSYMKLAKLMITYFMNKLNG